MTLTMTPASFAFDTPIEDRADALAGPWRSPRQMLSDQEFDGHSTIHDDATAQKLGFRGGTIEGPTHFSQFVPLGVGIWGEHWFREGCLSIQYKAACYEGERVRAFMAKPVEGEEQVAVWMEREDGVEVLRGTAGVGADRARSALRTKMAGLSGGEPRVIMRDVQVGMKRDRVRVRMDSKTRMGALYPFSLSEKLEVITEPSPWFTSGDNPWGRPIIPTEMASVLLHHIAPEDPWTIHGPTVDLFSDQEIAMTSGPMFVGEDYDIEREVVALSGSRRTESVWVQTTVYRAGSEETVAVMLINIASFKESYADYEADLARLSA